MCQTHYRLCVCVRLRCVLSQAIENFALTVKTTAQMLQKFGTDLAETELPNDVQCTKDLLAAHTEKHDKLRVGYGLARRQFTRARNKVRHYLGRSPNTLKSLPCGLDSWHPNAIGYCVFQHQIKIRSNSIRTWGHFAVLAARHFHQ